MKNMITEIRESKKMSMYKLAELSGLSRSQILKVEKMDLEDSNIRFKTLIDVAKGLDVSLLDVIGIEVPEVEKRIAKFEKKKITILKRIAKDMKINIKVEDE